VEFHPYLYQKELLDFCREHHIVLTAYSPLAQGRIFKDQRVKELTDKYGFSAAQLVLKWLLEKGIVVIPKASSPGHLKDNLDVLDLDIDAKVLGVLDGLNENMRLIFPDFHEFDLE
jgi:diketogulonate reductase-like aldo/keto reductase